MVLWCDTQGEWSNRSILRVSNHPMWNSSTRIIIISRHLVATLAKCMLLLDVIKRRMIQQTVSLRVDPKTQCWIESDDKRNRLTARPLNSDKKIELAQLNQKLFNDLWIPDYGKYMPFQNQSHFDGHGNLVLMADYIEPVQGKSKIKQTYLNPCKL